MLSIVKRAGINAKEKAEKAATRAGDAARKFGEEHKITEKLTNAKNVTVEVSKRAGRKGKTVGNKLAKKIRVIAGVEEEEEASDDFFQVHRSYTPQEEEKDCLTICVGDIVQVLDQTNDQWWYASHPHQGVDGNSDRNSETSDKENEDTSEQEERRRDRRCQCDQTESLERRANRRLTVAVEGDEGVCQHPAPLPPEFDDEALTITFESLFVDTAQVPTAVVPAAGGRRRGSSDGENQNERNCGLSGTRGSASRPLEEKNPRIIQKVLSNHSSSASNCASRSVGNGNSNPMVEAGRRRDSSQDPGCRIAVAEERSSGCGSSRESRRRLEGRSQGASRETSPSDSPVNIQTRARSSKSPPRPCRLVVRPAEQTTILHSPGTLASPPSRKPPPPPKKRKSFPTLEYAVVDDANEKYRPSMEDMYVVDLDIVPPEHLITVASKDNTGFFGVYDGHGGRGAAEMTSLSLHRHLQEELSSSAPEIAMTQAFLRTDCEMKSKTAYLECGCTVVCALVLPNSTQGRTLWVANVGDARAVMGQFDSAGQMKAVRLSKDHKPDIPDENLRVARAGGWVLRGRLEGTLGVSRALGDFNFKERGLIAEPYIFSCELDARHQFLILACDGLWDVVSDEEAVSSCKGLGSTRLMAQSLVDLAMSKRTTDNVTVMVVRFQEDARGRKVSSEEQTRA